MNGQPVSAPSVRTWTRIGQQLYDKAAAARAGRLVVTDPGVIVDGIEQLSWVEVDDQFSLPLGPGMALTELAREARPGLVDAVAWGVTIPARDPVEQHTGTYELLAVQARYANGRARLFAVDCGIDLLIVASEFTPTTKFHSP